MFESKLTNKLASATTRRAYRQLAPAKSTQDPPMKHLNFSPTNEAVAEASSTSTLTKSPIDHLPVELLSKVLWFSACPEQYSLNPIEWLNELRTVCKYWKAVIDTSPELGADICLDDAPIWVTNTLNKPGDHPINVTRWGNDLMSRTEEEVFTQLCSVIPRWQDVTVSCYTTRYPLLQLLESPAPLLREFTLQLRQLPIQESPIHLFSGEAPRLRRLSLAGLPFRLDSPTLQRLQSLSFRNIRLYPATVVGIVSECRSLEYLELWSLVDVAARSEDPSRQVVHQLLRSVNIVEIPSSATQLLLSSFTLPGCRSCRLIAPALSLFSAHIVREASFIREKLFTCLPNIITAETRIRVSYVGSAWLNVEVVQRESFSQDFTLKIGVLHGFWPFVGWIGDQVGVRITDLALISSHFPFTTSEDVLARLMHLERLVFDGCYDATSLICMLGQPSRPDKLSMWRVPNLTDLTIKDCSKTVADNIVTMLIERRPKELVPSGPSIPLKLHTLRMIDDGLPA